MASEWSPWQYQRHSTRMEGITSERQRQLAILQVLFDDSRQLLGDSGHQPGLEQLAWTHRQPCQSSRNSTGLPMGGSSVICSVAALKRSWPWKSTDSPRFFTSPEHGAVRFGPFGGGVRGQTNELFGNQLCRAKVDAALGLAAADHGW
jgi:hypothetical protein